ncbi:MAG TPA: DUF5666 domain-containing protein [Anaeromyxobacteraceae bacterium]|nr:DUF5666 domain-containing protein [Anaeromyxobacteraceae bacterium]
MRPVSTTLIPLGLAALLAACGGSSSSSAPGGGGGGGGTVTPNLFLVGTISARTAGQIEVNGVAVSTPATVRIDGADHPESDLKQGMVVKVKAHGSGRAAEGLEVESEDAVRGKVESKDAATLSVGGQTVRVDDSTEFEDRTARLGSIAAGDRVRVSGVPDDKGGLRATRIDKEAGTSEDFEVKGIVSGVSSTGFTLKLSPDAGPDGTFTVDLLGGATLPTGLADGAFVEVRSAKPVQAGNVIEASSITVEDRLPGQAGAETEVEGIVTSGTSAAFVVDGTSVTTTSATAFDGGAPSDLVPGVKVEAEGVLGADGVLAATRVAFRDNVRLVGRVAGLAVAGASAATFTVNGVAVAGDAVTDWRTAPASLAAGDWVEVRGRPASAGAGIVATRVEVQSPGNARPAVQGVVSAFDAAAGTVTILGETIGSDASTELQGERDASGVEPVLARADFFAALTAGLTVVKVTGPDGADWTAGASGAARSMELEGER